MATLLLMAGDNLLREIPVSKTSVTIGRDPQNDLVIADFSVSAHHARIVTGENDCCVEDLNSTNGILVNGQPVKKHHLQDLDWIEIGLFRLQYSTAQKSLQFLEPDPYPKPATVRILTGPSQGREIELTRAVTTLGNPGVQVAVLTRCEEGYSLTHVEGEDYPTLNGQPIGVEPKLVKHGDVLLLAGATMAFSS